MKRILKKILIIIILLLLLNNFVINSVHAANEALDALGGAVGGLFSGVVGILTWLYRAPAVMFGWLINRFMTALAYAEGTTSADVDTSFISIFDILFNRVKILDINFFDLSDTTSLVGQFRLNVAAWFYIMRNISAGILLVILVYIGIRMAISTVASDRAMYKRMLADWAVSLFLIFVLNYIIIFTIEVNNAIVKAMAVGQETNAELASVMGQFGWKGINPFGGISSIVAAIIYIMLIWQTMALFFSYFNRMLKIAFLIIISPLISLTYSIDKIGDGKAQALDAWLKEFVFTILMQPFHCAIYMSLISTAIKVLIGLGSFNKISETLGAGIMALVCITFTKEAEKIIRKIFAFKDDNSGTSLAAGAILASATLSKAKSIGTGGAKFVHGARDFIKDGANSLRFTNVKAETIAAVKYLSGKNKDEDGTEKDYKTLRSEEREKAFDQKAIKVEHKEDKELIKKGDDARKIAEAERKLAIENEKARLNIENNGKMTDKELEALARLNVAKSRRPIGKVKKMTKKAYTRVNDGLDTLDKKIPFAETRALLGDEVKKSAGFFSGAGTLGLSGKVSGAAAAASATNQIVEQFNKNNESRIAKDVDKLLGAHSLVVDRQQKSIDTTDPEDKIRDKKSNTLNYIIENSDDYELDGDTIPDRLKSIIKEINDAFKDNPLSETKVKQTIKNSKNPASQLNGLINTKEKVLTEKQKSALEKLKNYGTEYAISQKFASASQAGVSSSKVIQRIGEHRGDITVDSDESKMKDAEVLLNAKKAADNFITQIDNLDPTETQIVFGIAKGKKDDENRDDENREKTLKQVEEFDREISQYKKEQEKIIDRIGRTFNQDARNREMEFERKKAILIGSAIQEIKNKNEAGAYELRQKIIKEVEQLLKSNNNFSDDEIEELKSLKKALEDIKNNNS